jgi:hypothetical protein
MSWPDETGDRNQMTIEARTETEIAELMDELEALLKNSDVGAVLTARGINTSLALLVAQGLRSYLQGQKAQAAEDLATAAEEIGTRLRAS